MQLQVVVLTEWILLSVVVAALTLLRQVTISITVKLLGPLVEFSIKDAPQILSQETNISTTIIAIFRAIRAE
jgi:hypothetical protein